MLRPSMVMGALADPSASTFRVEDGLSEADLEPTAPFVEVAAGGERFVPEGQIGSGGMGVVVRAWDTELRRRVALKWLRDDIQITRPLLLRFLAEAQLTAQLAHPGIVPVHDIGVTNEGRLFYVMKLVEGRTLAELIDRLHGTREPDTWTATRLVAALHRAMEAVAYAHDRGVLHRDLKPDNLILGGYGEVWIIDWGIAKVVTETSEIDVRPDQQTLEDTRPGAVVGTPTYASPEQLVGDQVDERTDVYALGAVLHEILTGLPPYAEAPRERRLGLILRGPPDPREAADAPEVPDGLARICMRALQPNPDDRFTTVHDMASAVEQWIEGERQRERDLDDWVRRQLHLSALAVDNRATRIADALSHLVSLSGWMFADKPRTLQVERWLRDEEFEVDEDGYYQPRGLAPTIRAGEAPPDALSWCWPPSRSQDPIARRHMYSLRKIGPTLLDMATRVTEVSFWYFADARNVALVFPADDMKAAVPSEFDFLSYPAFVVASPEQNPERELRATPPHVDYGNKGLITAMTRPVYVDDEFVGVWAADVPVSVLHSDVRIAETEREITFIIDRDGLVVAHPRDRTLEESEKGAVFDTRIGDLGGVWAQLDPASMFQAGSGSTRLRDPELGEVVVRWHAASRLGWLLCHATQPR